MPGFLEDDIKVVEHADRPPLTFNVPTAQTSSGTATAFKSALQAKWELDFKLSQRAGCIPPDDQLSTLPAFQHADALDSQVIQEMKAVTAQQREAERRAAEKAAAAEAEKQRRSQEKKEEAKRKRREEKELSRQERILEKKEAKAKAHLEADRRYKDLLERWQKRLDECRGDLEKSRQEASRAEKEQLELTKRIEELSKRKHSLMGELKEALDAERARSQHHPDQPPTNADAGLSSKHSKADQWTSASAVAEPSLQQESISVAPAPPAAAAAPAPYAPYYTGSFNLGGATTGTAGGGGGQLDRSCPSDPSWRSGSFPGARPRRDYEDRYDDRRVGGGDTGGGYPSYHRPLVPSEGPPLGGFGRRALTYEERQRLRHQDEDHVVDAVRDRPYKWRGEGEGGRGGRRGGRW